MRAESSSIWEEDITRWDDNSVCDNHMSQKNVYKWVKRSIADEC
jgi:hypothetical protein